MIAIFLRRLLFLGAVFTCWNQVSSCKKDINPALEPTDSLTSCIDVNLISSGTDSQTVGLNVPIQPVQYTLLNHGTSDTTGLSLVAVSAIGLPEGLVTTRTGNIFTISGSVTSNSASPYVYEIVASGLSCKAATKGVITVGNCATLKHISGNAYQHLAAGTPFENLVYNIGGGGTGAAVVGLPAGLTGTFAAGVYTISGTPTNFSDSTYNFKVTTTGGICNVSDSGQLSLAICPTITLTSDSSTLLQYVHVNEQIQPITYRITGADLYSFSVIPGQPIQANFTGEILTITGFLNIPPGSDEVDWTAYLRLNTSNSSCALRNDLHGVVVLLH